MKVNFDIIDNYALSYEGRLIDLHNNFEFAGFSYKVADKEVHLSWIKSSGTWVDNNELLSLILVHKAVTFLNVIGLYEKSTYNDDCCLGEITFFPSAERELNDDIVIIPQSKPNNDDDIIYFFENGQKIRINCEQIELLIELPKNM